MKQADFAVRLRGLLGASAASLFDAWLALMEQDIAAGWRAFYARELWLRDHLSPPLINEPGRAYMIEQLRQRLRLPFGEEHLPAALALPQEYRNYLETGQLTVFHRSATPWDLTADAVATGMLETEHRHAAFEMVRNELDWYVAACERCTLTPPLLLLPKEEAPALRGQAVPLAYDNSYWWALCQPAHRIVLDGDHNGMLTPAVNRELMAALAPDFPYSEALSSARRLVFVQQGDGPRAWAMLIDKTGGAAMFRYPPQLILIERASSKKLKDAQVLFQNVIGKRYFTQALMAQRAMELELRFHLPRMRRLIAIYQPFVDQAGALPAVPPAGGGAPVTSPSHD